MIELKDLRVFVVEDNFQAMNLVKGMLSELGISQVYTAKDGGEALTFLGNCDDLLDLVLCDWNMPKLTGLDVLRQVRTVDPDLPFIMITGAADSDSVISAKASGVTAYIAKPFSQDELKRKLNLILRLINSRASIA
jgi:two-component system, chemotaxis family, chemotaxis protein CheY